MGTRTGVEDVAVGSASISGTTWTICAAHTMESLMMVAVAMMTIMLMMTANSNNKKRMKTMVMLRCDSRAAA